ncbi:MAG: hypothetical protein HRU32_09970 [Rhodobacteraceae bacterium]|nr:hypothetical protein [Paracoccaceae bacterium]
MPVAAQDAVRVQMTALMLDSGFDKHLLPRFKFKHRITLEPVKPGEDAEIALVIGGSEGAKVFATTGGAIVRLVTLSTDEGVAGAAGTFRTWLNSTPGKSAIDAFAPDGTQVFSSEIAEAQTPVVEEEIVGDAALGSDLALRHCGRCHVVDERNRMGGIGSTPSFAALRGRDNWSALFLAYYVKNPHPSFTQVLGLTEPFTAARPSHVQPVELTLEDVEAITAFVGTLEPLDLGRPVQSR